MYIGLFSLHQQRDFVQDRVQKFVAGDQLQNVVARFLQRLSTL